MRKEYVYVKTGKSIIRVNLDEIIYVEKEGREAILVTEKEEIRWYCTMDRMKELVDERFITCHRSYLVNMDKIIRMENQNIWLEGGFNIIFGRESFRKAMRFFRDYVSAKNNCKKDD